MILADVAATHEFGLKLSTLVRAGDAIALAGPLGAGKTSLARGILAGLGLEGEAPSPSFAIVQPYDPPEVRLPVLHIDLYRVDDPREIDELGLEDARDDSLLLIEWPERMGAGLWKDVLALTLTPEPSGARRLTARVPDAWKARWSLI